MNVLVVPGAALVQATGWTLLHTLWQGAAVAGLLAFSLWLLRGAPATARYTASCAALVVLALCPLATLPGMLHPIERTALDMPLGSNLIFPPPASRSISAGEAISAGEEKDPCAPGTRLRPSLSRQDQALTWMAGGWAFGVCLLSIRMLGGWFRVQDLARRDVRPLGGILAARCRGLSDRLGIHRRICLLESREVQVPTVFGWVRAVVLIPASALTGLPTSQLEAILAHELAHVRRNDYIVNLLQSCIEAALFYHPAVWWISAQIRAEREYCCDDMAIHALGDRIGYARALAALEELRAHRIPLVLAANGGCLLARVRRVLGAPAACAARPTPRVLAAWIFGICLLGSLVWALRPTPTVVSADPCPRFTVDAPPPRAHGGARHLHDSP